MLTVRIRRLGSNTDLALPTYMTGNSAGMDIFAALEGDEVLLPGERKLIPTGIEIEIPKGYEAQVRPRSGLAVKNGVTVLNTPGTVDSDYRGEIKVILINQGEKPFVIKRGDRIAQMIVSPVSRVSWDLVETLDETERGRGGFGHTG
ncbi:MAG: dUTP diphosphatase [Deltaproteobacteria bacterium]|jgi:dUTP pyrophosphatase|nr:dUTP diphosphatase [Deltaproteobacteria bacterium]MBN2846138.1 dUTP diphosphatase [Deltaproteobacteria bacterium]